MTDSTTQRLSSTPNVGNAAPAAPDESGTSHRVRKFFDRRVTLRSTFAVVLAILAIAFITSQLLSDSIIIEAVPVPQTLVARGYTPEVAASRILDHLLRIRSRATTVRERRSIGAGWGAVDITVPSTGLSLQSMIRIARMLLGAPDLRVSGEILHDDSGFLLRLRTSDGSRLDDVPSEGTSAQLEEMFSVAAEQVFMRYDPFTLAAYYWPDDPERAGQIARYCLSQPPPDDDVWAINLLGLIANARGNSADAIRRFAEASRRQPRWWVPHHNWGVSLLAQGRSREATARFQTASDLGGHESPGLLIDWASALIALNEHEAAHRKLTRARNLNPYSVAAIGSAIDLAVRRGRTADAVVTCSLAEDMGIRNAFIAERCGDAYVADARYAQAARSYEARTTLRQLDEAFCIKWGKALLLARDAQAAVWQFENALQFNPASPEARSGLEEARRLLNASGPSKSAP